MKIKIYRGAKEIGGSCVEIQSGASRIIIDIGMPLVHNNMKFDFNKYEDFNGQELVKKKILPDIPGFYEWDNESKLVEGLLVSHAHMDHYGFFRFLKKDVCYYLGEATKKLIDITVMFTPMIGEITNLNFIESGKSFNCGEFTITPYLMDHSAFDAYAFLIEAEDKKIIYSGDFREHGRKNRAFEYFLSHAPANVDVFLLEGTSFGRQAEKFITENDIEEKAVEIAKDKENIMLLYLSGQNIDRLVSFYRASLRTKRIFVIDIYTANILDTLKDFAKLPFPSKKYSNIRVFYPYWLCQRITENGNEKLLYKFKEYKITKEEISEKHNEIMMMVRGSMIVDLEKLNNLVGATFIYSMWEGYKQEKSMRKMIDFIKIKNMKFVSLHISGHASVETLKKIVKRLKPQRIIPIHTFYPDDFNMLGNCVHKLGDGESLEI